MLLSILIPTFNGVTTLEKTLTRIVSQLDSKGAHRDLVEIVICDDCSTDLTPAIAKLFTAKYSYIHFFRNKKNLGMDRNFYSCVRHSRGKFVWFFGQDDLMLPGATRKVVGTLEKHPNIGFLFLNYEQFDEVKRAIVCPSMFRILSRGNINSGNDRQFVDLKEYFDAMGDIMTFLPATIMRRECWNQELASYFFDTHYVQYGVMLMALDQFPIYLVPHIFVRGIIPKDGWQKDGKSLYHTMLGSMKVKLLVLKKRNHVFSNNIISIWYFRFLVNWCRLIPLSRWFGYIPDHKDRVELKSLFGGRLYYLFLLPVILVSSALMFWLPKKKS